MDGQLLREAKELHKQLRGLDDDFTCGMHRKLPWPELRAPPPSVWFTKARETTSTFTFNCIGREFVKRLEYAVQGCFRRGNRRMLIGNLGSGKTHLLALTVLNHYAKCYQPHHRVAAIFTMPRDLGEAFTAVQRALLVAFGDKDKSLDAILALKDHEEMVKLIEKLDNFVFVVDAWNEADGNTEVQRWLARVVDAGGGCLQGTKTVQGSETIRNAREEIELFMPYTTVELINFLILSGVYLWGSEDYTYMRFLEQYTGRVPLFVTVFCKCYDKVQESYPLDEMGSDEVYFELGKLFRGENEVAEMACSISECFSTRLIEFIEEGVSNVKHFQDIDIRYVVKIGSKFHPATPYAKDLYQERHEEM